jgi:hypothetical protein
MIKGRRKSRPEKIPFPADEAGLASVQAATDFIPPSQKKSVTRAAFEYLAGVAKIWEYRTSSP